MYRAIAQYYCLSNTKFNKSLASFLVLIVCCFCLVVVGVLFFLGIAQLKRQKTKSSTMVFWKKMTIGQWSIVHNDKGWLLYFVNLLTHIHTHASVDITCTYWCTHWLQMLMSVKITYVGNFVRINRFVCWRINHQRQHIMQTYTLMLETLTLVCNMWSDITIYQWHFYTLTHAKSRHQQNSHTTYAGRRPCVR